MNDVAEKLINFKEDVVSTFTFDDDDETRRKIVNGIVRDRILFYIARNYNTNFWYLYHYYTNHTAKPSSTISNKVQEFIDDTVDHGLSYNDIREYYYKNVSLYKSTKSQTKVNMESKDITFLVKPKQGSKFFSINGHELTLVDKENATVVTNLMNKNTTMAALKSSKSFKGIDDFILVMVDTPQYHLPSTLEF